MTDQELCPRCGKPDFQEQEERIEGTAWKDGDQFCAEGDQESYIFVPNCPHDDDYRDATERLATLILRPEPAGGKDG